jgi:hypothetical protein
MVKPRILEAMFYIVLTACVLFGVVYGTIRSYFLFASLAIIVGLARYVLVEAPRLRQY